MNLKKLLLMSTLCLSMISPSVVEAKEKSCQSKNVLVGWR